MPVLVSNRYVTDPIPSGPDSTVQDKRELAPQISRQHLVVEKPGHSLSPWASFDTSWSSFQMYLKAEVCSTSSVKYPATSDILSKLAITKVEFKWRKSTRRADIPVIGSADESFGRMLRYVNVLQRIKVLHRRQRLRIALHPHNGRNVLVARAIIRNGGLVIVSCSQSCH